MTISTTSIKNVYSGNGVATVFSFTFPIAAETELEVYLLESGFLVLKTLTTDYTITGVGNPSGGSVSFVTPPPTVTGGADIVLARKTPLTQLADYIEGDSFPAETHEAALDKLTKIAQEHAEALDRAAQLPINSSEDVETLTQAILLVADNSTNISAVAANETNINAVAANETNINAVVANETNINAVVANETNINAAVTNEANINAAVANETNINAVAANEANINAAVADLPSLSAKVSKTGDAMSGLLQLDQSSDIVAAATTDLGTATGNAITVTHASGTLAITSFGGASLQSGTELTITWSVSGGTLTVSHNATSLILPSAANLTIADGDVWKVQKISDSLAYWRVISITKADGKPVVSSNHGQCILIKDGSDLKLIPKNGNKIIINGSAQSIPSTGITLAATGLTPGTLYYIYAYMASGTMTLEASATGHSADASTGVEIKTGDATRTLVGMASTITGPAWMDAADQRFVRSWFNDTGFVAEAAFTTNRTTASSTFVEINTEIRNRFLSWDNETIIFNSTYGGTNSAAGTFFLGIAIDGTSPSAEVLGYVQVGGGSCPLPLTYKSNNLSEGYHYSTIVARTHGGTLTLGGAASGTQRIQLFTGSQGG